MKVKIELFATLRDKYGKSVEVECDGTLKGAFYSAAEKLGKDFLKEIFNEKGEFRDDRIILVNGRNIKDEMIEKLKEGTKISVFPPVAGG